MRLAGLSPGFFVCLPILPGLNLEELIEACGEVERTLMREIVADVSGWLPRGIGQLPDFVQNSPSFTSTRRSKSAGVIYSRRPA
jgi:hypothetical protein